MTINQIEIGVRNMLDTREILRRYKIGDMITITSISGRRHKKITGSVVYIDGTKIIVQSEIWMRTMFTLSDFLTKRARIEVAQSE